MSRVIAVIAVALLAVALIWSVRAGDSRTASVTEPVRAAFFYPWFPNAWAQQGFDPFTNYTPTFGFYDSQDDAIIDQQLALADRANLDAFISSWWGPGHHTDAAIQHILDRTNAIGSSVDWALYYEEEGQSDPSVAEIEEDLRYMKANIFNKPSYMKIQGKPVLFVYADGDGSNMAARWAQARIIHPDVYLVLKVFSGYRTDPNQPDSWHQYGPAVSYDDQTPNSVSVSPGFWKKGDGVRLVRDLARFESDVDRMVNSGAFWHLITTWNEWGEGTQIEPDEEFGNDYIDVLCRAGGECEGQPTPTPLPTSTPTVTNTPLPTITPGPSPTPGASVTLVGAGDISTCDNDGDEATALLLDSIPGTVFTVGDNVYPDGTASQFANCYDPTWGRHKERTRPAPGNHDYNSPGAAPYYDYFGANAGPAGRGFYSYDLGVGAWHVISLASSCSQAGGCEAGSPQETWLRADLAANTSSCVVAYWHHTRFSSSSGHGSDDRTEDLWQALYDAGADIIIQGHDHTYERFAKQDAVGNADPNGIRSFVVGTGGKSQSGFDSPIANSEVRASTTGVLKLTLRAADYDWEFVPIAGESFTDSGTGQCAGDPPSPTVTPVPPTATPIPTVTPTATTVPTDTPVPSTATPTATSTVTPVPSPTDTPTVTPVPLCEVLVRIDGVEQWVEKPIEFCL